MLDVCTRWTQTYDRGRLNPTLAAPWAQGGRDVGWAIDTATGHELAVLAGASENEDDRTDPLAVAIDTRDGSVLWAWHGEFGAEGRDQAHQVAVDGDRGHVVLGLRTSEPQESPDAWIVSLDLTDGDLRWATRIPHERDATELVHALAVAADGTVFAAGEQDTGDGHRGIRKGFVARLDLADGTITWRTVCCSDGFRSLAVTEERGRLFAVGTSGGEETGPDVLAAAFDVAGGDVAWTRWFVGSADHWDFGFAVGFEPGSTVVVGGDLTFVGQEDREDGVYRLLSGLDPATGEVVWQRLDGPSGHGTVTTLHVEEGHGVGTGGLGTVAFSASEGTVRWEDPLRGSDVVVSSAAAQVYATTTVRNLGTSQDCLTRAYGLRTGDLVWEAEYRGPGPGVDGRPGGNRIADRCKALAVDPGTDAVVVGGDSWQPGTNADALAIGYEQTPDLAALGGP